jgi:hypothetical protein
MSPARFEMEEAVQVHGDNLVSQCGKYNSARKKSQRPGGKAAAWPLAVQTGTGRANSPARNALGDQCLEASSILGTLALDDMGICLLRTGNNLWRSPCEKLLQDRSLLFIPNTVNNVE